MEISKNVRDDAEGSKNVFFRLKYLKIGPYRFRGGVPPSVSLMGGGLLYVGKNDTRHGILRRAAFHDSRARAVKTPRSAVKEAPVVASALP